MNVPVREAERGFAPLRAIRIRNVGGVTPPRRRRCASDAQRSCAVPEVLGALFIVEIRGANGFGRRGETRMHTHLTTHTQLKHPHVQNACRLKRGGGAAGGDESERQGTVRA